MFRNVSLHLQNEIWTGEINVRIIKHKDDI